MKSLGEIELQLSRLGINNRFFGKPEVRELQHILSQDEVIKAAVNGRYHGGLSLLVATDRRLLLIDKKFWFLNIEDVRFDMILEIDYCAKLLDSTLSIRTFNKVLNFTAMKQKMLRHLTGYIQDRVMEIRHNQSDMGDRYAHQSNLAMYDAQPTRQRVVTYPETYMHMQPSYTPSQPQQYYNPQTIDARPNRIRKIGTYPTATLTTQRRFMAR